jgi:hypothetical protein
MGDDGIVWVRDYPTAPEEHEQWVAIDSLGSLAGRLVLRANANETLSAIQFLDRAVLVERIDEMGAHHFELRRLIRVK